MRIYSLLLVVICLFVFNSCQSAKKKPIISASKDFHVGELKAQLKKPDLIRRGGKLVVVPFKAGENAAASPLLDTIALMIVKGVADDMEKDGSSFKLLDGDSLEAADFILEGFIEDFSQTKSYKTVVPKYKSELKIKAQLRRAETNETILIYSDSIASSKAKTRPEELAYALGQKLALYLYQQSQSKEQHL